MAKQVEGGNRQRREKAKEARRAGKTPSEEGVTFGASKQRRETHANEEHAQDLGNIRRGKNDGRNDNRPAARPGSRGIRED
jgi:hypothetical protein